MQTNWLFGQQAFQEFKDRFFEGSRSYVGTGSGLGFPMGDYKAKPDKGAASTGSYTYLELNHIFAKYMGAGIIFHYMYNPVNLSEKDFPEFRKWYSGKWHGGGFNFGFNLSVPLHPLTVDFRFYPGYMWMRKPHSEGSVVDSTGNTIQLSMDASRDGGFSFVVVSGIRYEINTHWAIGLNIYRKEARLRFKSIPVRINGEMFNSLDEFRLDLKMTAVTFGVLRQF